MNKNQIDYVANALGTRLQRFWKDITMDQARELAEVAKQAFAESSLEGRERKELARLKAKYESDIEDESAEKRV